MSALSVWWDRCDLLHFCYYEWKWTSFHRLFLIILWIIYSNLCPFSIGVWWGFSSIRKFFMLDILKWYILQFFPTRFLSFDFVCVAYAMQIILICKRSDFFLLFLVSDFQSHDWETFSYSQVIEESTFSNHPWMLSFYTFRSFCC